MLSNLCKAYDIKKLVHISALGIKENHDSKYMQSKFQGEINIKENFQTVCYFKTLCSIWIRRQIF